MKRAVIVVNDFLKSPKFDEIYQMLIDAFREKDVCLDMCTNADLLIYADGACTDTGLFERGRPEFVLFFDKDVLLAEYLEKRGHRVFNTANAIRICDDKRLTVLTLAGRVRMPKTVISPFTFDNIGYTSLSFIDKVIGYLGYPIVVKDAFGSFGQQVYLANDKEELTERVRSCGTKLVFQELVSSSYGRDLRIQVVGDKAVASVLRTAEKGNFISNVTSGGKMKPVKADRAFEEIAVKACRIAGVDFGGVDLLFACDGSPILCEINSNAHFKNTYDACGVNVADEIAGYILSRIG